MKRPVTARPPRIIGTVTKKCARRRLMPSIMPASSMAGGTSSMKLFSIQKENGTPKAVWTRMMPMWVSRRPNEVKRKSAGIASVIGGTARTARIPIASRLLPAR